jgi:DNA ligase-associated metallophosphoesterase
VRGSAAVRRAYLPGEVIEISGAALRADLSGALYWPDARLLCVADLHLEKGSSFARTGQLLPPYDTAVTLARLGEVIARYQPKQVICLGDSFHDGDGPSRLGDDDRSSLRALQRGREWIWIAGNHDPDPASGIGGVFQDHATIGPVTFRHEPDSLNRMPEVAGHLHPVVRVLTRGRVISRKCFVSDRRRVVLPSFGAFTGGLNIRHRAIASIFGEADYSVHMLGSKRLYALPAIRCLADRAAV